MEATLTPEKAAQKQEASPQQASSTTPLAEQAKRVNFLRNLYNKVLHKNGETRAAKVKPVSVTLDREQIRQTMEQKQEPQAS